MKIIYGILRDLLEGEKIEISLPNLGWSFAELIEIKSIQALEDIKNIIEDDKLDDFECIERILCVFEQLGSDGGSRHDFS